MTAPSMMISDGSALSEMASNQKCQWIINPYAIISPISNLLSKNTLLNLNNFDSYGNELGDDMSDFNNSIELEENFGMEINDLKSSSGRMKKNEKESENENRRKNNNIDDPDRNNGNGSKIDAIRSLDNNHVQLTSVKRTMILEFLDSNLLGGQIAVYDGIDGKGIPLWKCNECTIVPRPIISISSTIFVDFSTNKNSPKGQGFQAVYWEILSASLNWQDSTGGFILETPISVNFNNTNNDNNFTWNLPASNVQSNLIFQPRYSYTDISSVLTDLVVDGRRAGTDFESYKDTGKCSKLL